MGQVSHNCLPVPPEIIDDIINYLHDDKKTLLLLGCVSKRALARCRRYLFRTIQFIDDDERFHAFLSLVNSRWTSFTSAVESIHLRGLFERDYQWHSIGRISIISANLCNVKTLCISSTPCRRTSWSLIPADLLKVLVQMKLHDVQLDSVLMSDNLTIKDISAALPPSVKSFSLYNLRFWKFQFPNNVASALRRIEFTLLDTSSLMLFQEALDMMLSNKLDILVHTFYLRLFADSVQHDNVVRKAKFFKHIGPSVRHLFVDLAGAYFRSAESSQLYDLVDFSTCINIRAISIGTVGLRQLNTDTPPSLLPCMWKILSVLPTPRALDQIWLTFQPNWSSFEHRLKELATFQWTNLICRLQCIFPNLKKVTILIGTHHAFDADESQYLDVLRRNSVIKALEEVGLVKIAVVTLEGGFLSPAPPWRDILASL
ncbi:hypothetical protein JOM56_008866 [Amanita muscaria]